MAGRKDRQGGLVYSTEQTIMEHGDRIPEDDRETIRNSMAELRDLLPQSDWLIVILPLTQDTHRLIGAAELAALPRGARFANIGRGPTVDEGALIEHLRSGRLSGAVLDVFEREPLPPESPLWDMPNVIISPHIGGDEAATPRAFAELFLANLRRYMAGEPLLNVVDKRLGWSPPTGR